MRFLLRIVAVLTMLLALLEAGVATVDFIAGYDQPTSAHPDDAAWPARPHIMQTLQRACHMIHSPAALFCYGAILFVLVRISLAQEEEVQMPPGAGTLSSGRKVEP